MSKLYDVWVLVQRILNRPFCRIMGFEKDKPFWETFVEVLVRRREDSLWLLLFTEKVKVNSVDVDGAGTRAYVNPNSALRDVSGPPLLGLWQGSVAGGHVDGITSLSGLSVLGDPSDGGFVPRLLSRGGVEGVDVEQKRVVVFVERLLKKITLSFWQEIVLSRPVGTRKVFWLMSLVYFLQLPQFDVKRKGAQDPTPLQKVI